MAGSTGSFTAPESSGTVFVDEMTPDDFSMVTDVKFLGLGIYSQLRKMLV